MHLPDPSSADFDTAYQAALSGDYGAARPRPFRLNRSHHLIAIALLRAYETAKGRAKRSGKAFELTLDNVTELYERAGGRCALTGCEFRGRGVSGRHHKSPFTPSIDRLDNARGYTMDNVRLVCVAANFALGEWGDEVFAEIARGFLEMRKPKRARKERRAVNATGT